MPASVDLSHRGFEVSLYTDSVPLSGASVVSALADNEDGEQSRVSPRLAAVRFKVQHFLNPVNRTLYYGKKKEKYNVRYCTTHTT